MELKNGTRSVSEISICLLKKARFIAIMGPSGSGENDIIKCFKFN